MGPANRLLLFIDSNVIFSGLYSSRGAPKVIIDRLTVGQFRMVISQQVLDEVVRVMKQKLPDKLAALQKLLISVPLEIQQDPAPEEVSRWVQLIHKDDAAILAAAVAAHPDYLVTGDRHFLDDPGIAKSSGLRIVTPEQFLRTLETDTDVSK